MKQNIMMYTAVLFLPLLGRSTNDVINIGNNTYSVCFEDTLVTSSDRSEICRDVSIVFSVFSSYEEVLHPVETGKCASYKQVSPIAFPDGFHPAPIFSQTNGTVIVDIPRRLSDSYTNAIAFVAMHRRQIEAATAWIGEVNSGSITNLSYLEKCELAYAGDMPEFTRENADNLARSLFLTHPKIPSILDYALEAVPTGSTSLTTCAKASYVEDGERRVSALPMIFHDGKWKYYLRQ